MNNEQIREARILHVDMKYEAESAVATLEENAVPAFFRPTPTGDRLGFPSAMGMDENGFDVFVSDKNVNLAAEVLHGIGYKTEFDGTEDENEGSDASEDTGTAPEDAQGEEKEERELTDEEKKERLAKSIEELPKGRWTLYKILFGLLFLVAVYFVVRLGDLIVELIKSAF